MLLTHTPRRKAAASHIVRRSRRPPAEEDAELRRRLDFNPDADFEVVLENMKLELGYGFGSIDRALVRRVR